MVPQQLYTLDEFAARYRISCRTVRAALRRGEIRAVTLGKALRIPDPGWKIMRFYSDHALYMEHFLRSPEVRRLLNVSNSRLLQYVKADYIHPIMRGGYMYFSLADVIQCANRRSRNLDNNLTGGYPARGFRGKIERKLVVQWAIKEAMHLSGTILGPDRQQHPSERLRREEQASAVWLMPSGD